ncbi:MAG: hypothetical protein J6B85_05045 [Lachnospiraceae bacterium]|nr:hypothetical protein [Lachnospiraceae bacterium]
MRRNRLFVVLLLIVSMLIQMTACTSKEAPAQEGTTHTLGATSEAEQAYEVIPEMPNLPMQEEWTGDAVVFYQGNTVIQNGYTAMVIGEYFDTDWKAVISDGTKTQEVELLQLNRQSFKVQIPEEFSEGVYTLKLSGDEEVTLLLNAPKVQWMQGDEGSIATKEGWLRLQGECLKVTEDAQVYALFTNKDGKITKILADTVYDAYSVCFPVSGLAEGEYQVRYYNGYAACDCGSITIGPSPEDSWRKTVYNVLDYGISNTADSDCSPALKELLARVEEEGGGIIYFPAGRYQLTQSFHIPKGVVLRGDGYQRTSIFWTDEWRTKGIPDEHGNLTEWAPGTLPDCMITGESNFAIENLEFTGGRVGELLKAGTESDPAQNVRIEGVRVNMSAFSGLEGAESAAVYDKILSEIWNMDLDMITITGENVKILDCDFMWSGRVLALGENEYFRLQNVIATDSGNAMAWMPLGNMNKAIIEDLTTSGITLGCAGDNVYFARFYNKGTSLGDHEGFTTDGSTGIGYCGPVKIDGLTYTFPSDTDMKKALVGSKLCIISGTGAGQYREITAVDGHTVTIDEAFAAEPDEGSHLTIIPLFTNWYLKDWRIDNCGIFSFYVAQCNTVVDGATITRSPGIKTYGKYGYGGYHTGWYITYLNNTLTDANAIYHSFGWYNYHDGFEKKAMTLPGYSFLYAHSTDAEPLLMGMTMRENSLSNNSLIYVRGTKAGNIRDMVIDSNHSVDCIGGIYIEGEPEGLILTGNTFERVEEEIQYLPIEE